METDDSNRIHNEIKTAAIGSSAQMQPAAEVKAELPTKWQVRRAQVSEADAICNLVREGMRLYAGRSGLSSDVAELQLTALSEGIETVVEDIENATVLVGISNQEVVASLRLKRLPIHLAEAIRDAGKAAQEAGEISLDAAPDGPVSALPSYQPEAFYLLSRFAVRADYRANGLGAAMMRSALRLASLEEKRGIFLYSAAENRSLLNFYRAFGFEVQSVSGKRGYARALLFAHTPGPDDVEI